MTPMLVMGPHSLIEVMVAVVMDHEYSGGVPLVAVMGSVMGSHCWH